MKEPDSRTSEIGAENPADSLNEQEEQSESIHNDDMKNDNSQKYGAWYVYWDENSGESLLSVGENIDELIIFSIGYKYDGTLSIPDNIYNMRKSVDGVCDSKYYISFTNDIIDEDNREQKSIDLLERLLADDETQERTVDNMVETAVEMSFDGIEVDFENIKKDISLWGKYSEFLNKLILKSKENNLDVRVVLGAYTPVSDISLPSGPEYVVMCYNLYGNHSGPGPKADQEFLEDTVKRFEGVENVRYALANGGFVWDQTDKVVKSVTVPEVEKIIMENNADTVMDPQSGTYSFSYDEDNYKVVYGDSKTIEFWIECLNRASGKNVKIDIWRIE